MGHYGPISGEETRPSLSTLILSSQSASMADMTKTAESNTDGDTVPAPSTPATPRTPTISIVKVPNSNSSPLPPSVARLWRPAAQRNLRNQWTKLAACRQKWGSNSSGGRSHATSLVNAFLSQRYIPSMELGVLKDLSDIGKKACQKLFMQQEIHRSNLLLCYRDMVSVVLDMVNAKGSMRCFLKQSNTQLVQFSGSSSKKDDAGDGGGIPVYTFFSVAFFEKLADELLEMFISELSLKRLLLLELLSARCEDSQLSDKIWSDELYQGELSDLAMSGLYSEEDHELLPPKLKGRVSDTTYSTKRRPDPSRENLQMYLTTWLAELNVDSHRVQEIFGIISEECMLTCSEPYLLP